MLTAMLGLFTDTLFTSSINGRLGSLRVQTAIDGAAVNVVGTIGSVFVGGSMLGDEDTGGGSDVGAFEVVAVWIAVMAEGLPCALASGAAQCAGTESVTPC